MPTLADALAKNLTRILNEKGITQTKLAEKIGSSFQTINNYMHGRVGVSSKTISQMAKVLEVEETDLISGPKLTSQDYREFYELSISVDRLRANYDKLTAIHATVLELVPQEVMQKLSKLDEEERKKFVKFIEDRVDAILSKKNIPSKKDVG